MLSSRYFRTVATLLAFSSLVACSNKKDPDPTPTPTHAPTQGLTWSADGSNLTAASNQTSAKGPVLEISGTAGTTSNLTYLSLSMPKSVGTYTITPTSDANAIYTTGISSAASQLYLSTTGSITLTSLTATSASGTFTFTATTIVAPITTKTITNGKFNVTL